MPRLLALTALLFALAGPALAQPADAASLVAAERAFAADARAMGRDAAALKWAQADAVAMTDGTAPSDRTAPSPVWGPNWAGISKSGDLGFTTSAVEGGGARSGQSFTIWNRQPDGGWKWVYDGAVGTDAGSAPDPATELTLLPTAVLGSATPDDAVSEVRTVEAVLAASALRDQKQAHLSLLASDGRLHVARLSPAIGTARLSAALNAWPATLELSPPFGGGASRAGDMVWTYGRALWPNDARSETAGPGAGHYVHLWQKRSRGWVLVFAQIITDPPSAVSNVAPPPAQH